MTATFAVDMEPGQLRALLPSIRYRDGWSFDLLASGGGGWSSRYLLIVVDSIDPVDRHRFIARHEFPVPPPERTARWGPIAWTRWVFGRCIEVDFHEGGEFFSIDGYRPFVPGHFPDDPYEYREVWPEDWR